MDGRGHISKRSSSQLPAIGTRDWWGQVLVAWNISPHARQLANFGRASFRTLDGDLPAVAIEWDAAGQARLVDEAEKVDEPCFSAPLAGWKAFVRGDFSAAEGVLKRHIRFAGSALSVLPYTGGFTLLAQVARSVTDPEVLATSSVADTG
jgi:hypothetical protein